MISALSVAASRAANPWLVYSTILIAIFIAQMGLGMRNSLVPFMTRAFEQPVEAAVWLTIAVGIVSTGLPVTVGKLSDMFGRKYVAAVGLYLAAVGHIGVMALSGSAANGVLAVSVWGLLGFVAAAVLPASPAFAAEHISAGHLHEGAGSQRREI